jgi:hypothetical protein
VQTAPVQVSCSGADGEATAQISCPEPHLTATSTHAGTHTTLQHVSSVLNHVSVAFHATEASRRAVLALCMACMSMGSAGRAVASSESCPSRTITTQAFSLLARVAREDPSPKKLWSSISDDLFLFIVSEAFPPAGGQHGTALGGRHASSVVGASGVAKGDLNTTGGMCHRDLSFQGVKKDPIKAASNVEASQEVTAAEASKRAAAAALTAAFMHPHHLNLISEEFPLPEQPSLDRVDGAGKGEEPKMRESYVRRLLLPLSWLPLSPQVPRPQPANGASKSKGSKSESLAQMFPQPARGASLSKNAEHKVPLTASLLQDACDDVPHEMAASHVMNARHDAHAVAFGVEDEACRRLPAYASWLVTSFSKACEEHNQRCEASPDPRLPLLSRQLEGTVEATAKKVPHDAVMGLVWAALQCCLRAMHQSRQGSVHHGAHSQKRRIDADERLQAFASSLTVSNHERRSDGAAPATTRQRMAHGSSHVEDPVSPSAGRATKRARLDVRLEARLDAAGGSQAQALPLRSPAHGEQPGAQLWCCSASTCTALLLAADACKVRVTSDV